VTYLHVTNMRDHATRIQYETAGQVYNELFCTSLWSGANL